MKPLNSDPSCYPLKALDDWRPICLSIELFRLIFDFTGPQRNFALENLARLQVKETYEKP